MDFLLKCLTKDPQKRPTAVQLLSTPFIFQMHLYQISRRVETTDVYKSYMAAFEKGWGYLQPLKSVSVTEPFFYDRVSRSFTPQYLGSEVVNVVLPVFECVPNFQSQEHGVHIHNWVINSDASFHMVPTRVDEPESGKLITSSGRESTTSKSVKRNNSVQSFASTEGSQSLAKGLSSPKLNKQLSDSQRFHALCSSAPQCPQTGLHCSLTCSTTSFQSPLPTSPCIFEDAEHPRQCEGIFEALADRIDLLYNSSQ